MVTNMPTEEQKLRRREYQKAWKEANPDKVQASRDRNKARNNASAKAWYEANKDEPAFKAQKAAYQKAYLATETGRATLDAWKAEHRESLLEYHRAYMQTENGRRITREACERRQARNRKFIDWLKDQPCADCALTKAPYLMDFDHLPGSDKKYTISKMLGGWSPARILQEAMKCEVVCCECHRKRTHKRGQYA